VIVASSSSTRYDDTLAFTGILFPSVFGLMACWLISFLIVDLSPVVEQLCC
jgi:hypothetical protein